MTEQKLDLERARRLTESIDVAVRWLFIAGQNASDAKTGQRHQQIAQQLTDTDCSVALLAELTAARRVVAAAEHAPRAITGLLKSRSQDARTDAAMCEAGIRSALTDYRQTIASTEQVKP